MDTSLGRLELGYIIELMEGFGLSRFLPFQFSSSVRNQKRFYLFNEAFLGEPVPSQMEGLVFVIFLYDNEYRMKAYFDGSQWIDEHLFCTYSIDELKEQLHIFLKRELERVQKEYIDTVKRYSYLTDYSFVTNTKEQCTEKEKENEDEQ